MHRIYCPTEPEAETAILTGEEHHYVSRVLRLDSGDRLILFDESGWEKLGRIEALHSREVLIRIEEKRPNRGEPVHSVWLLQGFPKGSKFFDLVRAATALGVETILPFQSQRSVGGKGGKSEAWLERCQKIAMEATRQCGRARAARVEPIQDSLEEALCCAGSGAAVRGICFWEEAGDSMESLPPEVWRSTDKEGERFLIVIGAEGGLTRAEAHLARERGLFLCHLGARILRTELAAISALSIVQYLLGEMR